MIFAPLGLKPPATSIERHADGSLVLSSDLAPLKPSATLIELFEAAEAAAPEAPFLSEPSPSGWSTISYGDFMRASRALAVWLLGRPEGRSGRPLAILSGNSVHHAIATIGACMIGKPVALVSPAYSLMSKDFERLGRCWPLPDPTCFCRGPCPSGTAKALAYPRKGCQAPQRSSRKRYFDHAPLTPGIASISIGRRSARIQSPS